jgi:archaellum biogenesis ATPase FlaH
MFNKITKEVASMFVKDNVRTYLIDGLIAHNSLNFITGVSNVGKSTVLYHLAKCIVDNENWFDFNTDSGSVLIFDNEMGLYDFNLKFDKLKIVNESNLHYIEDQFIDVRNKIETFGFYDYIENMVKNDNLKLVIIDSLSACCGNLDENSNTDMRMFMDFADKLSHICTTFVIHHKGKSENTEFRGASIIKDRSDNFFVMDKSGEIKISKNRSGRMKDQRICFNYSEDDSFIQLTVNDSNTSISQPKKDLKQIILDNLEDGMNQSKLFEKLRNSNVSFITQEAIHLLKTMKTIEIRKGPNNSSLHYHKS